MWIFVITTLALRATYVHTYAFTFMLWNWGADGEFGVLKLSKPVRFVQNDYFMFTRWQSDLEVRMNRTNALCASHKRLE